MKRINGYLQLDLTNNYQELVNKKIIIPLKRNKFSLYIDDSFFKEEDNAYLELIGSKIASLLNIKTINYDMLEITLNNSKYKGVISKKFTKDNYNLVNFNKIISDYLLKRKDNINYNEMNLELIEKAILDRYSNYPNKDIIISNIMNNIKMSFLLDILIGNNDNGKYNYCVLENNQESYLTPYYDFGCIFNFTNTRLTVNDNDDYNQYNNLLSFLDKEKEYITIFKKMYELLTPESLEDIIKEVEKDNNFKINQNDKNIIFLSYSRHYMRIGNILKKLTNNYKK